MDFISNNILLVKNKYYPTIQEIHDYLIKFCNFNN